ncbi:hypothetical protein N7520_008516 [Penicillium odoratum]|uniref:uncharacterized protein n=1 Tax=Penicillium odoratum TaxID=1167516 RepID=UPI002548CB11|nr:uncharacterized protein N7520_008516 [Penicillium odoratum]KAJ5751599.1 hypothetical protein N7520_008516 [Penicillium odoratum]
MAITPNQQDSDPRGKVPLLEVDARDGDVANIVATAISHMKISGGCVVRNLLPIETVKQIVQDFQPYLDDPETFLKFRPGTTSATGLAAKSTTFCHEVIGNEIWHGVIDYFLTYTYGPYWMGNEQHSHTGKPQMSSTTTFKVGPGGEGQMLHRDDILHYNWRGGAREYELGRDVMSVFFVALSKTTEANGATRVIPGSHLWDYSLPPTEDLAIHVELAPGDAFMSLGGLFHAGSANSTTNEDRLIAIVSGIRTELRQEENAYLTYTKKEIERLPLHLQRFLGYTTGEPLLGHVDMRDPGHLYNSAVSSKRVI